MHGRLPPWAAGLLYCTRTRTPPPEAVTSEDLEPNVRIYYVPARKAGVSAFTAPGSRC